LTSSFIAWAIPSIRGAELDPPGRIHNKPLTNSAASQPSQDRESPINNGEDAANVAGWLKISKAVLLGIRHGDVVACPDSLDVHVFGATVLGQYAMDCETLLYAKHLLVFLYDDWRITLKGRVAEDHTAFLCTR
jgi:hypothetical protein